MGAEYALCPCTRPKALDDTPPMYEGKSVQYEMNKFSDVMNWLSRRDENF